LDLILDLSLQILMQVEVFMQMAVLVVMGVMEVMEARVEQVLLELQELVVEWDLLEVLHTQEE
jgi:hypothetical protein